MFNLFRSNTLYQNLATLQGPQDAITSLAFSVHGKFLAAAGPGGVNVWNLDNLEGIPLTLRQGGVQEPEKVAFPAATWLYFTQRSRHVLLLGTWDGSLQLWDYMDEKLTLESFRKTVPHIPAVPDAVPSQVVSIDVFHREVPLGGQAQIVASFVDRSVWMGTLTALFEILQKTRFEKLWALGST